ncbi:ABC transporter permease [Leucobacter coleopterorum]|uniref:ABC transporter permease n=1 Tax=Leucobacter coleopterorum TaxID=2714933 RepID=A0ABX6K1B1_9MICO|nr:ABC transporter permease [Leucobacter coleopterorum]QIM18885.1 ABC transporter permease [Leucobacter coleopterorum]
MNPVRQTSLLLQWQLRRNSDSMVLLVLVQALLAMTTVLGYKMLIGDVTTEMGRFLATGAPTVTLIMVGLVMTPQQVAQSKIEGTFDWMRTLPVPRILFLVADLSMWTLIALPGMVLGVVIGAWQFGITLSVTPWVIPAALLVSLTSAAIGYGLAVVAKPTVAQLISQTLVFVVLLFSPISYPASRMPEWLQAVHEWLPIEPMADLMRATLDSQHFSVTSRSVLVLVVWCALAVGAASYALRRRV